MSKEYDNELTEQQKEEIDNELIYFPRNPSFNEIIDNIFIGNYSFALNKKMLKENKISHILNCGNRLKNFYEKDNNSIDFSIERYYCDKIKFKNESHIIIVKDNNYNNEYIQYKLDSKESEEEPNFAFWGMLIVAFLAISVFLIAYKSDDDL